MGNYNKTYEPSDQILLYYSFQKKMNKYLSNSETQKDRIRIKKGYLIHPEWIKDWKNKINYEYIKSTHLDNMEIKHLKISDDEKDIIKQCIKQDIKDFDESLIYLVKNNYFSTMIEEKKLTLMFLANFINEKTLKALNINKKTRYEEIEYIFKKKY